MKKLSVLLILLLVVSCKQEIKQNTHITGLVKGLKKGTLYLERALDTSIITVDSFNVSTEEPFLLETNLEEPEVLLIRLNKQSKQEDKIVFFAAPGATDIQTSLNNFAQDAEISGTEIQKKLEEYKSYMQKFNEQGLDIIKQNLEAQIGKNEDSINAAELRNAKHIKRKYLYATNFAVTNSDSEIAPYIAISEIYDANIMLLDTINNSLTPRIKKSKYGVQLQEFIDKIKKDSLY